MLEVMYCARWITGVNKHQACTDGHPVGSTEVFEDGVGTIRTPGIVLFWMSVYGDNISLIYTFQLYYTVIEEFIMLTKDAFN